MGQFILFLLGLFAIGCVLYGISAGVQMIQRGFAYLAPSTRHRTPRKTPPMDPLPASTRSSADEPTTPQKANQPESRIPSAGASPMQRGLDELRTLFALYQQGALTREEFDEMKRSLLSTVHDVAPQGQ